MLRFSIIRFERRKINMALHPLLSISATSKLVQSIMKRTENSLSESVFASYLSTSTSQGKNSTSKAMTFVSDLPLSKASRLKPLMKSSYGDHSIQLTTSLVPIANSSKISDSLLRSFSQVLLTRLELELLGQTCITPSFRRENTRKTLWLGSSPTS